MCIKNLGMVDSSVPSPMFWVKKSIQMTPFRRTLRFPSVPFGVRRIHSNAGEDHHWFLSSYRLVSLPKNTAVSSNSQLIFLPVRSPPWIRNLGGSRWPVITLTRCRYAIQFEKVTIVLPFFTCHEAIWREHVRPCQTHIDGLVPSVGWLMEGRPPSEQPIGT